MSIRPCIVTIHTFTFELEKIDKDPHSIFTGYELGIYSWKEDLIEGINEINIRFSEASAKVLYEKLKEQLEGE